MTVPLLQPVDVGTCPGFVYVVRAAGVFPAEQWGWARQVYQTRAVSAAYHGLTEAGS